MTEHELATLGGGVVAYIKTLTSDEASRMFPAIEGLPKGINLFSLHAADGTRLALTDTGRPRSAMRSTTTWRSPACTECMASQASYANDEAPANTPEPFVV